MRAICMALPPGILVFSIHIRLPLASRYACVVSDESPLFVCPSEAVSLFASTASDFTAACQKSHCRSSLCQGLAAARQEDESYLVGCDDGLVVRCSTAYDSDYLAAYGDDNKDFGHSMEASAAAAAAAAAPPPPPPPCPPPSKNAACVAALVLRSSGLHEILTA